MIASARLICLGIWVGGLAAFGGLFVPAAFSHLPTQLAAEVLGQGFAGIDRAGMTLAGAAVALGTADWARQGSGRGSWSALRVWLPLIGLAAHAVSLLWIAPEVRSLRLEAGGTIGQLPAGHPGLDRFAQLHGLALQLFGLAAATAVVCCGWDGWVAGRKKG